MNRKSALILLAISTALLASGCVSLKRPYPEKRYYAIGAWTPESASNTNAAAPASSPAVSESAQQRGALCVRDFRVAPGLRGKELVYRTGEYTFASDYYNEFFTSPGPMLAEFTRRRLAQSGLFAEVADPSSATAAAWTLEGNIAQMHGDFRDRSAPKAVLEIQVFLLDSARPGSLVIFQQTFYYAKPIERAAPEALVRGWDEALGEFAPALESALKTLPALYSPRPPRPPR